MFNLDDCIACITNRAGNTLAKNFDKMLISYQISRSNWFAIYYIETIPGINQKHLAEKLGFTPASVAHLVDKLENDGLIVRKSIENDNRVNELSLTNFGKKIFKELIAVSEKYKEICTSNINPEELAIFRKVLENMVENSNTIK